MKLTFKTYLIGLLTLTSVSLLANTNQIKKCDYDVTGVEDKRTGNDYCCTNFKEKAVYVLSFKINGNVIVSWNGSYGYDYSILGTKASGIYLSNYFEKEGFKIEKHENKIKFLTMYFPGTEVRTQCVSYNKIIKDLK